MQEAVASKKTLVLGASLKPERHSNMAVKRLRESGHPVLALGGRPGQVEDVAIHKSIEDFEGEQVHTITLYMNDRRQQDYYDFIFSLQPERIIFNPGAENAELYQQAKEKGILAENACTLVKLAMHNY